MEAEGVLLEAVGRLEVGGLRSRPWSTSNNVQWKWCEGLGCSWAGPTHRGQLVAAAFWLAGGAQLGASGYQRGHAREAVCRTWRLSTGRAEGRAFGRGLLHGCGWARRRS